MTDFGKRAGIGDMLKSVYDADDDGVIAVAQTEADMTKAVYDTDDDGKVDEAEAHASGHEDGGTDEIAASGLVGRINYVDRGDPSAFDKTVGDFTTDAAWHDLNLDAIVPAGAKAIHLRLKLKDNTVASYFSVRKNGNSNAMNISRYRILIADIDHEFEMWVSCDTDRIIEYAASATTFSNIDLSVRGWFI